MLTSILAGMATAGVVVLLLGVAKPVPDCPECGERVARIRWPDSGAQAMKGGWTCRACGCRMDRHGKRVGGEA
ncbi:hypothetical protein EUA93_20675 [Nocardioides oleivorans]|uniref:Uncharacterized protein n=1 Tax=Nocardioides oleivorans TaxID=273676 RepID=A0A4Q2RT74_9ACTN|nr:hypothetical protein [Nocardioides oleivorans]RYB90553.1 hypothetical protein EUA93_20675 [Nocardioides oleivorans]